MSLRHPVAGHIILNVFHIIINAAHLRLAGAVLKISYWAFGAHQRQLSAARAQLTGSLTQVVRAQRHGAFFGALRGGLIRGAGCAAQRYNLFLDTCVVSQLSTRSEGKGKGKSKGKPRKNMCGICVMPQARHTAAESLFGFGAKGKKKGRKKKEKDKMFVIFVCTSCGELARLLREWSGW